MIDLECPFCGGAGSIPREKVNTRLVCRKCHQVFHVSATGRPLPGEPPVPKKDHGHGHGHGRSSTATAVKKESAVSFEIGELNPGLVGVLGVLVAIGVLWLGYSVLFRHGPAPLFPTAQELAEAVTNDDLASVQLMAVSGTTEDASRWFAAARRTIDEIKEAAPSHEAQVEAVVTGEDKSNGNGEVQLFIIPKKATTRTETISRAAGTASARGQILITVWTLSGRKWCFDAKKSEGLPTFR